MMMQLKLIVVVYLLTLNYHWIAQCAQHTGGAVPLWLYNDADAAPANNNSRSAKLHELLALRVGPNIQASSDYHDFHDIRLEETLEAWQALHERARHYARDQVNAIRPHLMQLLASANVSTSCTRASGQYLDAVEQMDAWAVQMWSSTGSVPPVGLLDGHFTDLGSYRGCIDATVGTSATSGSLRHPASYCLVGFRPVVPSRVRFHQIFRQEDARIAQQFNGDDVFKQFAQHAQYFHYLYLKTGLCVPVECGLHDLQQLSSFIGSQWALMSAPVKCFTRSTQVEAEIPLDIPAEQIDNQSVLINLTKRTMNGAQVWALAIVSVSLALIIGASLWHALELLALCKLRQTTREATHESVDGINKQTNNGLKHVAFEYLSLITSGSQYLNTQQNDKEIKCLHGLRAFTMIWIICVHTLQYNDWSGFSRAFENEVSLQNPAVHPMINANYVVDNFFLMSGLLVSYTIYLSNKGTQANSFSAFKCLLGRYLRLTPQVALISLLNILLPLIGDGPFWYDMTHQAGRNCELNWWVNLLHIQAFYRADRMCNLVGWWISVDMFYYIFALLFLYLILNNRTRQALTCTLTLVFTCMMITAQRHYDGQFTPNNLATVPQIGEVWTEFVVNFVWTPYPHAPAFFLGLWLGWAMAQRKWQPQVRRYSTLGWMVATISLVTVNFSSRLWVTGYLDLTPGRQFIATGYNLICVLVWALALGWFIVACHYGCAPKLNQLLATKTCILLSKASFIIYLSHMLVVRAFYGSQYNLLEVSLATMLVIIISMVVMSIALGVFLCVAFEGPCLKLHRFVMNKLRGQQRRLPIAGASYAMNNHNQETTLDLQEEKMALNMNPTSVVLLK